MGRSELRIIRALWLDGAVGSGSCPMGVARAAFQPTAAPALPRKPTASPCQPMPALVPAEPCTRCKRTSRPYASGWTYGCTECRMRGVTSVADASVRPHIRAPGLRSNWPALPLRPSINPQPGGDREGRRQRRSGPYTVNRRSAMTLEYRHLFNCTRRTMVT